MVSDVQCKIDHERWFYMQHRTLRLSDAPSLLEIWVRHKLLLDCSSLQKGREPAGLKYIVYLATLFNEIEGVYAVLAPAFLGDAAGASLAAIAATGHDVLLLTKSSSKGARAEIKRLSSCIRSLGGGTIGTTPFSEFGVEMVFDVRVLMKTVLLVINWPERIVAISMALVSHNFSGIALVDVDTSVVVQTRAFESTVCMLGVVAYRRPSRINAFNLSETKSLTTQRVHTYLLDFGKKFEIRRSALEKSKLAPVSFSQEKCDSLSS
jgi:hypothetical protein